jgi:hypothetical protein
MCIALYTTHVVPHSLQILTSVCFLHCTLQNLLVFYFKIFIYMFGFILEIKPSSFEMYSKRAKKT